MAPSKTATPYRNGHHHGLGNDLPDVHDLSDLSIAEPEEITLEHYQSLQIENAELRTHVEELERLLAAANGNEGWAERQREYENLLDEKSEVIRTLHYRIQELEAQSAAGAATTLTEDLPDAENLLRLKRDLEEQRLQLQEDEDAMTEQMRQMELALSRDRAELARQRLEIQRLQADLNREIETATRDPGLRDRLASLQQVSRPKSSVELKSPEHGQAPSSGESNQKKSGFFRRVFG